MRGDEFFVQVSRKPPFTKLDPQVGTFFKEYLAGEKIARFGDRFVVNTNFPPYPSRAFDNLAEGFQSLGDASERRLYSVTLAVTNRCPFNCWHCYNAGRSQEDMSLDVLRRLAGDLQELGAVMVKPMRNRHSIIFSSPAPERPTTKRSIPRSGIRSRASS
jgi:hypothetical protein